MSHCNYYRPQEIGNWNFSDQEAVTRFQAAYGLKIDGILGQRTIGALNGPVIHENALQC
jgi:murein L,D-transpeptidase YcbB/YkuD